MKRASSIKKTPIVVKKKTKFLKMRKSGKMSLLILVGGTPCSPFLILSRGVRRVRIRMLAILRRKRNVKVRIRVAHLKPTRGKSRWSMRGKTMPPIDPPVVASPVATARLFLNQCAMAPTAGVKMREEPMPEMIEKVRIKCHNSIGHVVSDLMQQNI